MASSKVEKVAGLSKMPSTVVLPSACVRLSLSCAVASRHTGVCSWYWPGCGAGFPPVHAGHFPVDQHQLIGLAGIMRLLQGPQGGRAAVHRQASSCSACSMWTKTSRAAALSSTTSAHAANVWQGAGGCLFGCALPSLQVKLKQLPARLAADRDVAIHQLHDVLADAQPRPVPP
jgi:hypothetical protein